MVRLNFFLFMILWSDFEILNSSGYKTRRGSGDHQRIGSPGGIPGENAVSIGEQNPLRTEVSADGQQAFLNGQVGWRKGESLGKGEDGHGFRLQVSGIQAERFQYSYRSRFHGRCQMFILN
jgi:hypothetical protein